jgi:hypothetical protein
MSYPVRSEKYGQFEQYHLDCRLSFTMGALATWPLPQRSPTRWEHSLLSRVMGTIVLSIVAPV